MGCQINNLFVSLNNLKYVHKCYLLFIHIAKLYLKLALRFQEIVRTHAWSCAFLIVNKYIYSYAYRASFAVK